MNTIKPPESETPIPDDAPPAFDKTAARARYRALMRSKPMRFMYALTTVVILATWILGIAAAYAPEVKNLPNHDITVAVAACKDCHNKGINAAPAFNHSYAPSCGFCHQQGLPPAVPASIRVR